MKVDNCLGCCSLKKGVLIIGIIHVINSIVAAIGLSVMLGIWYYVEDSDEHQEEEGDTVLYVIFIICLVVVLFQLIISALLIHGALKERKGFILPWLIASVVSNCFAALGVVALICVGSPVSIGALIGLGISIYLEVVVHSFYKSLRSDGYRNETANFAVNSAVV